MIKRPSILDAPVLTDLAPVYTAKVTNESLDTVGAEESVSDEVFTVLVMKDEYESELKQLEAEFVTLDRDARVHQEELKVISAKAQELIQKRSLLSNSVKVLDIVLKNFQTVKESGLSEVITCAG